MNRTKVAASPRGSRAKRNGKNINDMLSLSVQESIEYSVVRPEGYPFVFCMKLLGYLCVRDALGSTG
jgi:hypothetical protein